jgi:hypothetical protein
MKTFSVFSVTEGKEAFFRYVYSTEEGKAAHADLKKTGAEYIRVRDCLGGLRFEYNLKTGRKTA